MIFFILILLILPNSIKAAEPLDVVINEIAWMGTEANSPDEWIELYNNTNQDINLKNWSLYEGKTKIEDLNSTIKANSYYLIERTDNNTIKNIEASQEPTSWGGYGLNNNGENLRLIDQESNIIDQVDCSDGWFAGNNQEKRSMERIDSKKEGIKDNWQTNLLAINAKDKDGNIINGTPKAKNSQKEENYSSFLIINEILPSSEGPDSQNEWIEIKNTGEKKINLLDWSIRDKKGTISTCSFPETFILPQEFLILSRPESNITLNNSEDCLELIQPNKKIISSVCYVSAPIGESYSFINSDWLWTEPSPNKTNIIPKKDKDKSLEKPKTEIIEIKNNNQSINNQQTQEKIKNDNQIAKNNTNDFITIFLIAILSSLTFSFFILKLKQKINIKI